MLMIAVTTLLETLTPNSKKYSFCSCLITIYSIVQFFIFSLLMIFRHSGYFSKQSVNSLCCNFIEFSSISFLKSHDSWSRDASKDKLLLSNKPFSCLQVAVWVFEGENVSGHVSHGFFWKRILQQRIDGSLATFHSVLLNDAAVVAPHVALCMDFVHVPLGSVHVGKAPVPG